MSSFLNSVKEFFFSRFDRFADERDSIDEEGAFIGFIRQQAGWIKEHVEYEQDIANKLTSDNEVIVKFNIEDYLVNFDKYFLERKLYSYSDEELLPLLLHLLIPPEDIRELLSEEHRRILFAGVMQNICVRKGIKASDLVRNYYKILSHKKEPFRDKQPGEVLELFKEAIWILERREWKRKGKIPSDSSNPDLLNPNLGVNNLLNEISDSFSIRNHRSISKLFKKSSVLRFMVSEILQLILIIGCALVLISYGAERSLGSYKYDIEQLVIPLILLLLILIVSFVVTIIAFITNRLRRRLFFKSLKIAAKYFHISHNQIAEFFKERFDFDMKYL